MTQTASYRKRKDYKFLMYYSNIAFWQRDGNVIYVLTWGDAPEPDAPAGRITRCRRG